MQEERLQCNHEPEEDCKSRNCYKEEVVEKVEVCDDKFLEPAAALPEVDAAALCNSTCQLYRTCSAAGPQIRFILIRVAGLRDDAPRQQGPAQSAV